MPAGRLQAELDPIAVHGPFGVAGGRVPRGVPDAAARPGTPAGGRTRVNGGAGMTATLRTSTLPLPLLRRGKVREVYEAGPGHLLLVASDRVSAFDVVMQEAVPRKGAVLTQLSAFWFRRLRRAVALHHGGGRRDRAAPAGAGRAPRPGCRPGDAGAAHRTRGIRVRGAGLPERLRMDGVPRPWHAGG